MSASSRRARTRTTRSAARSAPRRRRLWWIALALLAALLAPAAALLVWATRPAAQPSSVRVTHWTGRETPAEVAARLAELGLLSSPRLFAVYLGWLSPGVGVEPGAHLVRGGLSARELVQRLARLSSRPVARVVVPEGYTYLELAARLEQREVSGAEPFRVAVRDPRLLAELGIAGDSAEGYLFPATYELFVDSDARDVVRQMAEETRRRLERLALRHGGALGRLLSQRGWTERDFLTLASIVEKEAAAAAERALVASVFFNRLDDTTFRPARTLQSDPTAAYGCRVTPAAAPSCAGFRGRVTAAMLRDAANPYNTYRHPGLPPGPIANAGEGALEAVLAPAATDYLYFVADGRGRHRFSRTFEEHRRAIEQPGP